MTLYCSKECQKSHHEHHSTYCSMIVDLKKIEVGKLYKNLSVRQVQVDDKVKGKLVKLIGDKPMLHCFYVLHINILSLRVMLDLNGSSIG